MSLGKSIGGGGGTCPLCPRFLRPCKNIWTDMRAIGPPIFDAYLNPREEFLCWTNFRYSTEILLDIYPPKRYAPLNYFSREKGRDPSKSYGKRLYSHRKIKKVTRQHKHATKNFDKTTITDRLRTVSWSNNIHSTGMVKPVKGIPTFTLTAKLCNQKDTHLKKCK